ncbi:hypothetical protein RVBP21_0090 [Pseudomonas phage BRkr]|nr:hypothetical protein RVBP21_0090 [Pseudomonas phage BRkr]
MEVFETSSRPDPHHGYLTGLEVTAFNGKPIVYGRNEQIKVAVYDGKMFLGYIGNGQLVSKLSDAKWINGSSNYHIKSNSSNLLFTRAA